MAPGLTVLAQTVAHIIRWEHPKNIPAGATPQLRDAVSVEAASAISDSRSRALPERFRYRILELGFLEEVQRKQPHP